MNMNSTDPSLVCQFAGLLHSNGIFQGDKPLDFYMPRLAFQLVVLSFLSLAMQELLKPLGQTRYVSNLVAGLILGPTVLGRIAPGFVGEYLLPKKGEVVLQCVVQFGLRFWYFLMGAQIHVGPMMKNVSKGAALIGTASLVSPLIFSYSSSFIINKIVPATMRCHVSPLFMGLYFTTTTLSVTAGHVIDHELLGTDLGNIVMPSAIFSTVVAIMPLHLILWLLPFGETQYVPQWRELTGVAYTAFLILVARPIINWAVRRIPNEEDIKEYHIAGLLLWAQASAAVTDYLGVLLTFGAFMAGLVMPHCTLTTIATRRLEDFNTTLFMPPFFAYVGLSIDLWRMFDSPKGWTLVVILLVIYLGKIGFIALTASRYKVSTNQGLVLGMLLSSKGILDILLLTWAMNKGLSNSDGQEFAIMMLGIVVTSLITRPTISFLYDGPKLLPHKGCRAIQELKPNSDLRILASVYDHHAIPSILSLVKVSHATKMSPINLSVLHLVHTTSRESTVQQQSLETGGFVRGHDTDTVHETLKMHKWGSSVTFSFETKLSSYSTMSEHICNKAESGSATIIIVPFHIRRFLGSHVGVSNDAVRSINLNVLERPPCSVGILVDMSIAGSNTGEFRNVAVLFFGGPHDREALSYASRVAHHDPVRLTVVRFKPALEAAPSTPLPAFTHTNEDDIFINRFRSVNTSKTSITYAEKFVSSGADTVSAIQGMGSAHDLFIVGRRHGPATATMMSGLEAWSEYPELGTVGDLLVSPDFSVQAVLVVQQHLWREDYEDDAESGAPVHDLEQEDQTYRYVLHDQSKANSPWRHRAGHGLTSPNGVEFDKYGWNWNLRAGF